MAKQTALFDTHVAAGAKMVDFGGWDMPINYGSQIKEHNVVRVAAGMFDVSHMTVVDISGADAKPYLRYLLANDVEKLQEVGRALYSGMLNEQGGVIDDLIVYRLEQGYRVVVNCGTREKDLAWMALQAQDFDVLIEEKPRLAMLAIQGPQAISKVNAVLGAAVAEQIEQLALFSAAWHGDWFIARTGYTGEDGLEIILPSDEVVAFWQQLKEAGVAQCGLGARDTLRLEAGMNLYGNDMDDGVSPYAANMGWTIAMKPVDRNYIGRAALEAEQASGLTHKLCGLVLLDKGVLRSHQLVNVGDGEGEVTSGSYSPTLDKSIALARLPIHAQGEVVVNIRNKNLRALVVTPPFVRNGVKVYRD